MKTVLILLSSFKEASILPTLKKSIIDYFGSRMISDVRDDYPMLDINGVLTNEDRTNLSSMVEHLNSQSVTVQLIETEYSGNFLSNFTFVTNYGG